MKDYLELSHQKQDYDHQQYDAENSARIVAPATAVRPRGKSSE
jgi:hypothetical protein